MYLIIILLMTMIDMATNGTKHFLSLHTIGYTLIPSILILGKVLFIYHIEIFQELQKFHTQVEK